jgi:cytidine deaminase
VNEYKFSYEVLGNDAMLKAEDRALLLKARAVTEEAYAPYSGFFVGAAALLANGQIVTGTNQENASFPAGICAERVLLSAVTSLHKGIAILTIAISYKKKSGESDNPVSPCGICRQSLVEFENRFKSSIRLILSGQQGKVFILGSASFLLPLSFGSKDLG